MRDQARPLAPFEYFAPGSLKEVLALLHGSAGARVIAGGTDLMLLLKDRVVQPEVVIDLNRVPELSFVERDGDKLRIGAAATLNEIRASPAVREWAPLLLEAIAEFGSHMLRNRATIGGNLCHASPAADLAPPLLALDASVILRSIVGERSVPLSEFFAGPGQTVLQPGEVLREIEIPCRKGVSGYLKLGRRKGFNISIVAVAVFGAIEDGKAEDMKLALCAVGPTPFRSRAAEAALNGNPFSADVIDEAARLVRQDVERATDIRKASATRRATPTYRRATSPYRVEMSQVMARRVLTGMSNGAGARK